MILEKKISTEIGLQKQCSYAEFRDAFLSVSFI